MGKILLILLAVVFITGGFFYYGYQKGSEHRKYGTKLEELISQVPEIPEVTEGDWQNQIQKWKDAVEKIEKIGPEAKSIPAPKDAANLKAMVDLFPEKMKAGLGEIKFLAFSEKILSSLPIPPTKSREEAETEITKSLQKLSLLMNASSEEQGKLGPEFTEKGEEVRRLFEEYHKNLQQALSDVKQGKSVHLDAGSLTYAIEELRKDVLSSLKSRQEFFANLKQEIQKEKSKRFIW